MKNFIFPEKGFLLLGALLCLNLTSKAQNVNAYAFTSEPSIDGIIDDAWASNDFLEISHLLTSDEITKENFSGRFKISWYSNNLYFLFEVTDDIFVLHKDQPIWLGDNINLYLDLGNEKSTSYDNNDYLCQFKWGNSDYYERYNGNSLVQIENSPTAIEFEQTCDTINHRFIMEIAIRNLAELNGTSVLSESTTIGLDAGIYDCDDNTLPGMMYSNQLSWVDTTGYAWSDPSKLGTAGLATVVLKSAKGTVPVNSTDNTDPLKIYPTIVANTFYLQNTLNDDLRIEVTSLPGFVIESFNMRSENISIDVSMFINGLYFVNVYNSKGSLIDSQKIFVFRQ